MSDQPRPTRVPLSQRVRPDCEVAGYVHREIVELEREPAFLAERIAELEADLGETAAMRDAACAICSDVRAENAKLREALTPFSAWYEKWMDGYEDDVSVSSLASWLTIGDLRRASQALAGKDMSEPTA